MKPKNKKTIYSGIFILILLFSFLGCGEKSPESPEAWYKKGIVLSKLGRYEKAIEIKPDDASAWSYKGDALEKLGRKKEAQKAFEKANELKKKRKKRDGESKRQSISERVY